MSTVKCLNCPEQISSKAEECPSCRFPAKWNLGKCRSCDKPLARTKHRFRSPYTYVVEGTTKGGDRIQHSPCPTCGEPQPLLTLIDRLKKVVPVAAFVALAGATFVGMRSYNVELLWSLVAAFVGGGIGAGLGVYAIRYFWIILVGGAVLYLGLRK